MAAIRWLSAGISGAARDPPALRGARWRRLLAVDPTRLLAFGDDLRALLEQSFRTGGDICAMVNTESAKIDRAATFGAKRCRS